MDKRKIKILAFLEKPIGQDVFDYLEASEHLEIVAVVTNQSKNNWWEDNSIWVDTFENTNLMTFPSERRLNLEETEKLSRLDYDLVLSVQYRWKIPRVLYEARKYSANIHFSPLPYYKGHHTFFHAILDNTLFFGVTLHELEDDFDAGKIIDQRIFLVENTETAESLYEKCVELGRSSVFSFLDNLVNGGRISTVSQIRGGSFYAKDELETRVMKIRTGVEYNDNVSRALYFPPVINHLKEKFKSDPSKLEFLI